MRRIRLIVAYDGVRYHGWQIQESAITIEGELTRALRELLREDVEVIGASRTDSGVHALGNVAVFDTDARIPPEKIAIALNHHLPEDIRVQRSEEVEADFHPRHCNSIKTYEYTICATKMAVPVLRNYAYHVYHELNVEKMRDAARKLEGIHDFSAFCSAGSPVENKVRRIIAADVSEEPIEWGNGGRLVRIRVSGNGFLYNMVRIIAGTLIEIGMGRQSLESVERALETGSRQAAGPTAPPQGLMLLGIDFQNGI